jgi:hypothetical protein
MGSTKKSPDHKVAVTVEIGTIGDATVFVQIETVGRTLSQEQASARARQAISHFAAETGNAAHVAGSHQPKTIAQNDPEALFRSWAMPSSSN